MDPSLPRPTTGRTFAAERRVRLSDIDAHGRVRLDSVARFLQDVAIDDCPRPVCGTGSQTGPFPTASDRRAASSA